MKQGQGNTIEVIDFDEMIDVLHKDVKIPLPTNKAQEELKYLMCLDFKYLEMVMLIKFDKVMHDLDYISIDLLRQAQDYTLDEQRKMKINHLKRIRDKQLAAHKKSYVSNSQNGQSNLESGHR